MCWNDEVYAVYKLQCMVTECVVRATQSTDIMERWGRKLRFLSPSF